MSETILAYLVRNLRAAGAGRWPAIAARVSTEQAPISEHLLRKIAYGDRENPTLEKVQPLLDFFRGVEAGQASLPEAESTSREAA